MRHLEGDREAEKSKCTNRGTDNVSEMLYAHFLGSCMVEGKKTYKKRSGKVCLEDEEV